MLLCSNTAVRSAYSNGVLVTVSVLCNWPFASEKIKDETCFFLIQQKQPAASSAQAVISVSIACFCLMDTIRRLPAPFAAMVTYQYQGQFG